MSVFACKSKLTLLFGGRPAREVIDKKGIIGVEFQRAFTQAQTFELAGHSKRGLLLPCEKIMRTTDHPFYAVLHRGEEAVSESYRTGEYGFYRKGFARLPTVPFGGEIIWVEKETTETLKHTGRLIVATLRIPTGIDVEFDGINKTTGGSERVKCDLRQAYGFGIVDFSKLNLRADEDTKEGICYVVDFDSSLDPKKDLRIVVDASKYSHIINFDRFEDSATGWHGSFVYNSPYPRPRFPRVTVITYCPAPRQISTDSIGSHWFSAYEVIAISELEVLLQRIRATNNRVAEYHRINTVRGPRQLADGRIDDILYSSASSKVERLEPLAEEIKRLQQKTPRSDEDIARIAVCFEQANEILSI